MKKFIISLLTALAFTEPGCGDVDAFGQTACVPSAGGKCLTQQQLTEVETALKELDAIHKAPAVVTTTDKITIISDWQGRVYVDGGSTAVTPGSASPNQLHLKLTVGSTVNRDMVMVVPTQVFYRNQPPDPMFRLRIRAQAGLLVPQLVQGDLKNSWDIWASLDFFHIGVVNMAANLGVRSISIGPGFDLTKNFGITGGYALVYDNLKSSVFLGAYFSFN